MQRISFGSILLVALATFDLVFARINRADFQDAGAIYTNTHFGHGPAGPITGTPIPTSAASSPTGTVTVTSTSPSSTSQASGTATGTSSISTPQTSGTSSNPPSGSGWCIDFTTTDGTPPWYWTNSNPWTGSGDESTANQCFEADDSAGGAMWIGTSANPNAGNTKLECFFPTSGMANCDISLVDGYSLSVQCLLPDAATIGLDSSQNLWDMNNACPGTVQDGYCTNPQGYAAAITDVDAFFQPAINTCYIWQYDGLDPEYAGPSTISCTVSGSAGPTTNSTTSKRDERSEAEILAVRDNEAAHRRARKGRGHARGLDFVAADKV